MKVLSLFSGVGGFDMGLEQAGMQTVFQCEWDKHANNILHKHWPTVPKWEDISTLTGKHILEHAPVIDVVAWGSPCQDLSVAGRRAGLEGSRSNLFHEGIRIIKELRELTNGRYPRISIWENVAGALSSNKGADFGVILDEMAEAGALVQEWRILDAQYFGVPQRRRRVFLISVFDLATAANCPDPLLPIIQSVCGNIATGRQAGQESANQVTTGFTSSSFAQYTEGVGTIRSNGGDLGGGSETVIVEPILIDGRRIDDVRVYSPPVQTMGARMGTGGNNVPMIAFSHTQGLCAQPSEQAWPTLRVGGSGHAVAYEDGFIDSTMAVRRLTPIECERLMGWPDDHTRYRADGTEQADTHRYKQCGNGVASPVAKWIAEQLMKLDNGINTN